MKGKVYVGRQGLRGALDRPQASRPEKGLSFEERLQPMGGEGVQTCGTLGCGALDLPGTEEGHVARAHRAVSALRHQQGKCARRGSELL